MGRIIWSGGTIVELGGGEWDIYGQLVAPDGSRIGQEIAIATAPYEQNGNVSIYADGRYIAVWSDGRRHINVSTTTEKQEYWPTDVYARFINTDGSLGPELLIDMNGYASDARFAAFDNVNKKYLIVYDDEEIRNSLWKSYGRFIDNNGNVSPRFTISDWPSSQLAAIPCFDGTKYLVTWMNGYGTSDVTTKCRFFDTNGNKLGNEITLLTKKGSENFILGWPFFNGSKYFLSIVRANASIKQDGWVLSDGDIYGLFFNP